MQCKRTGLLVEAADCGELTEPIAIPSCTAPCANFGWFAGPWSDCSEPCGWGRRSRAIECVDLTNATTSAAFCPHLKPAVDEDCHLAACSEAVKNEVDVTGHAGDSPHPVLAGQEPIKCDLAATRRLHTSQDGKAAKYTESGRLARTRLHLSTACNFMRKRGLRCAFEIHDRVGRCCRQMDCENLECGKHGRCESGYCHCEEGYSGVACHLFEGCRGFVTQDDECCTSAYASVNEGTGKSEVACCPDGQEVDKNGLCCAGTLDGCVSLCHPCLLRIASS